MVYDQRRHRRNQTVETIEFVLNNLSPADESFDGVITDISESGLCLLTTNMLHAGEKIIIQNSISTSPRSATVRWSTEYNEYYKAGLEFLC
jgi:hypothetical protein